MKIVGIKPERYALKWASAAEGPLYVELVTKFTRQIKELGPLGEAEEIPPDRLKARLAAAKAAVQDKKLRTQFARLGQEFKKANIFDPEQIQAKMAEKVNDLILKEIDKQ